MKYLHDREDSSNTLRTYCTALKFHFTYLEQIRIDYQDVSFEKLSDFIAWLRNPYESNKVVPHSREKKSQQKLE